MYSSRATRGENRPASLEALSGRCFRWSTQSSKADSWRIRYDEQNSCMMFVNPDGELLDCICVNRPCGVKQFWDAVFQVMRLGNVVLYFPGCPYPLVANESARGSFANGHGEGGLGRPDVYRLGLRSLRSSRAPRRAPGAMLSRLVCNESEPCCRTAKACGLPARWSAGAAEGPRSRSHAFAVSPSGSLSLHRSRESMAPNAKAIAPSYLQTDFLPAAPGRFVSGGDG